MHRLCECSDSSMRKWLVLMSKQVPFSRDNEILPLIQQLSKWFFFPFSNCSNINLEMLKDTTPYHTMHECLFGFHSSLYIPFYFLSVSCLEFKRWEYLTFRSLLAMVVSGSINSLMDLHPKDTQKKMDDLNLWMSSIQQQVFWNLAEDQYHRLLWQGQRQCGGLWLQLTYFINLSG